MSDYTAKGRCLWHPKFIAHRPYAVPEHSLEKTHKKKKSCESTRRLCLEEKINFPFFCEKNLLNF